MGKVQSIKIEKVNSFLHRGVARPSVWNQK